MISYLNVKYEIALLGRDGGRGSGSGDGGDVELCGFRTSGGPDPAVLSLWTMCLSLLVTTF